MAKKDEDKELDEAELKAESDRIEAEKAKKAEEKRKEREAKENTPETEKMYTKSELLAYIKQAVTDERKKADGVLDDSLDDEDPFAKKTLRLPRFTNKFILSFENQNNDPYFPDSVVQAFDVYNEQSRRNEPYVKVVFEDATTLTVPLYTVIAKSTKVDVEILEIISKDTSYVAGKVEQAEVKGWSRLGTGDLVKVKVTQADYKFKIKLPNGDEVIVGPEVVNW